MRRVEVWNVSGTLYTPTSIERESAFTPDESSMLEDMTLYLISTQVSSLDIRGITGTVVMESPEIPTSYLIYRFSPESKE